MNNRAKLYAVLICLFAVLACACVKGTLKQNADHSTASGSNSERQIYHSVGVIKRVDPNSGKITIDHEDIPGYMGAMEMTEAVRDKNLLETVKPGDKVEFEIERTGAALLITKLNKIGEVAQLNGTEIYQTNCTGCHGANGEGKDKGISLLKGHALHHSEQEFIEQVTNGEAKKMPAFKDKLSAREIAAVVKFVLTELQRENGSQHTHQH